MMKVAFSNMGTTGQGNMQFFPSVNFWSGNQLTGTSEAIAQYVILAPMEVQVLVPA
jgi:hypothetical protein